MAHMEGHMIKSCIVQRISPRLIATVVAVLSALRLFMPAPGLAADVEISGTQSSTQNLDSIAPGGSTALVNDSANVAVAAGHGITAPSSSGWTLTNNGGVNGTSGVYFTLGGAVINSGSITGTGGASNWALYLGNGAGANNTVINNAGATIGGSGSGTIGLRAFVVTPFSLDNSGIIYGTGACAVLAENNATIINRSGGQIIGGYGGTTGTAIHVTAPATIHNAGIITGNGASAYGVYVAGSGNLTNAATGAITGGGNGGSGQAVYFTSGGNVDNSGTITGNNAQGVLLSAGGSVINRSGGQITANGATIGVNITGGTGTVTNEAGATISSTRNGVVIGGSGTIVNAGTISGTETGYYGARFSSTSAGTYATNVNNTGTISGAGAGLSVSFTNTSTTATNTITNSGIIRATSGTAGASDPTATGSGISIHQGTFAGTSFTNTIANSGTITGVNYGIRINRGSISNTGGTIQGATGILFTNSSNDFLFNSGVINGTSGVAVNMGSGNDTATLDTGSAISGIVDGGDGTDSMSLTGNGSIDINQIVGFETLAKNGTGTWTLTGSGASGASTTVHEGTLVAAGTIGDAMLIASAGTLSGTGAVGTVINSGTIAPGNSIGTLTISGDYTHNTGAVYEVEVNPAGGSDLLFITGTATINGGTVQVLAENGVYPQRADYTILHADGGLTGEFDTVLSNLAFFDPMLSYNATDAMLSLERNQADFSSVALTHNQEAVAETLDTASLTATGDAADVIDNLLTLSAPRARRALDQLGGATYTAFPMVDVERTARYLRSLFQASSRPLPQNLSLSDLAQGALSASANTVASDVGANPSGRKVCGPWGAWLAGQGVHGQRHGDDIASRFKHDTGGLSLGLDYAVSDTFRVGISAGFTRSELDWLDLDDQGFVDSYQTALYATVRHGRAYLDAAAYYAFNEYEMTRDVAFGSLNREAEGDYSGSELAGYLEGGYRAMAGGFEIRPSAALLAIHHHQKGFTETGADSVNLVVDAQDASSVQSILGIAFSREFAVGETISLRPEANARWVHEFGDNRYNMTAHFADMPADAFTVRSDAMARDSALLGLGLTGTLGACTQIRLFYDAHLQDHAVDHALIGGLQFIW